MGKMDRWIKRQIDNDTTHNQPYLVSEASLVWRINAMSTSVLRLAVPDFDKLLKVRPTPDNILPICLATKWRQNIWKYAYIYTFK